MQRKELRKRPATQSLAIGTSAQPADDEMPIEDTAHVTPPSKSSKIDVSAFGLDAVVPFSGFMSNYTL